MASGGAEEDDGGIPLDIDNVHMLLQVEQEQIQKRTFTNWINAQLAKRCPPSFISNLFSDLRDGSQLLDLLEVMSGQSMKRQRGHGVFQQRANIETALNFLKKKSIKLVNINIPDIIDGRPSIILGLIWSIILHCHIEELANALSFSSRHSSLDSLSSLDSWSSGSVPSSPVPAGRTSPLHRRFRVSAKKALLMWVRDQCQKVHCSISVKNFKSSWRSGEAFLAILCSLRPQLVDLSLVQSRSNQENLEEAFHLAERELHIPRLLEPQDVDVNDPDEKSIMTYVAQFLQYSNDMPAPDDHLQLFPPVQPSDFSPVNLPAHFTPAVALSSLHQVSSSERAQQVTCWLQQTYQELLEAWRVAETSSYAEKYQVFQSYGASFAEQKRPVTTLLATLRRRPELNQDERTLKTAFDCLDQELQKCKSDLDLSLPHPLDSVLVWLQRAEVATTDEGDGVTDHADAAKAARAQQDALKTLNKEMSHYDNILDTYQNINDSGNVIVPHEKFDEIKKRVTTFRVTAKYQGIKLEYAESRHTLLDLLSRIKAKVQSWKAACKSQEATDVLLQDWHDTVERENLVVILMDALQNLKEKALTYTSKAALGDDYHLVTRQVKEAESETDLVTQAATACRRTLERAISAWTTYNKCLASLQEWLPHRLQAQSADGAFQEMSEWTSCQAQLNQAGNFLIEVTEASTSRALTEQLRRVNMQWAECVKKNKFAVSPDRSAGESSLQMVHSLTQEANCLLRQPVEVASVPLKALRQKLQTLIKKMADADVSSSSSSSESGQTENLQQTLPSTLCEAERTCGELQRAASKLEGHLAELDRWNTDAQDFYNHLKEKTHRGHSPSEATAKELISRGSQLMQQAAADGRDLPAFVTELQKNSPLQYLSTSDLQKRLSLAVSHCQEILEKFSSRGFKLQKVPESQLCKKPKQAEKGLLVVAKTKHVEQIGNVLQQTVDPVQLSSQQRPRDPQGRSQKQQKSTQHGKHIVEVIQTKSQFSKEPVSPHVKEDESELLTRPRVFPQSSEQVSSVSQQNQLQLASRQTPVGPKCPADPVLTGDKAGLVTKQNKLSSPSQTDKLKRIQKTGGQPGNTSSQPPVMNRSEVHSKAQSMAKSRLEKARSRLQGRIQQAMKLFGGKEVSESQAKKKQKALKLLQPAVFEEFLGAVECFGAFCSGPQLQDLMLLSDSVRNQWEAVRREMAEFLPLVWSEIRGQKQPFSVVWCEVNTNALGPATDQTDRGSLQPLQQAVTEGDASIEELRGLCETLTPSNSSCFASDQLKESDEVRETQASNASLPAEGRGQQLRGNTPLRATDMSADTQLDNNSVPLKRSLGVSSVDSPVRDVPDKSPNPNPGGGPERNLKSSLRAREQLLKARLLDAENEQQTQSQAVVRSNTVETKQEAERTVIPETAAPSQEELPSEQVMLKRYRESCLQFHCQLKKNQLHLEEFVPDPITIFSLENQNKHLQTLKKETEALWFDVELQYAQLCKVPELMTSRQDQGEVKQQLIQQWREQQMLLQTRMVSLESAAHRLKSADDLRLLISEKLNKIIREPVNISSLSFVEPERLSDLQEMNDRLQAEMRTLSQQSAAEERRGSEAASPSSLCQELHNSVRHLEQLRQQLEKAQSAVQALDRFLAAARGAEAEIPTPLADEDSGWQQSDADREQERHSWQAALQRLQAAAEQSDRADSSLKAAGMTVAVDGETVTCQDVLKSVSMKLVDMEKKLLSGKKKQSEGGIFLQEVDKMHEKEESIPVELHQTRTLHHSPQQIVTQKLLVSSATEEESMLEAQRSRLQGEGEIGDKPQTAKEDALKTKDQRQRRVGHQAKEEGEGKALVKKKAVLLAALRETKGAAEKLRLREPTLPALQQRTRALTELERTLAGLLPEVQYIRGASSQSERPDETEKTEVEDLWEEATKAVSERLDQCSVLTELLRSFQSLRTELSGTLQRAEGTIGEQASYMGKNNLQRLHTKVQETKGELNGLGDAIEAVRSICRQLHSHLRQIPDCTSVPFENEADTLMDRWLDLSERTDCHLENLHLSLTLWDGVLKLGAEVEKWTDDKLADFTQCPSFQDQDDVTTMQSEIETQEENIQRFHRRSTEIQQLLQSSEFPLELQVVETQIGKKMEQLKELVSEAEDIYKQMVATKEQMSGRMEECLGSLQQIQDSLLSLKGPDVATVLAKLKDLCWQLHRQDEQAESLLEDVSVMASIAGAESLRSLSESGALLQEEVRKTQQLFAEVEEQTERNIQDLDRLQAEKEDLEQWLYAAEEKAAKGADLHLLKEETLQQSVRTELLNQHTASLRSSNLQQLPLLEESDRLLQQYHNFHSRVLGDSKETRRSLSRDLDVFSTLWKSTQSWVKHLRQIADSSPAGRLLTPVEQKLHSAQTVFDATAEGEARLQELRVTGAGLFHRLLNGDELKGEVEDTIQKAEEQWRDLLASTEPYYTAFKAEPELVSSYLDQRRTACRRAEELQHQIEELATLLPCRATAERTQACRLAEKLLEECNSFQLTLTSLAERRSELAERTGDDIWRDSSWSELDVHGSELMAKIKGVCSRLEESVSDEDEFGQLLRRCQQRLSSLQERMSLGQTQSESSAGPNTDASSLEALLQEVTDMEKDILHLATLKDSTAEASSLSQEFTDLKSHKSALESSIRENLALLGADGNQSVQQIEAEVSRLQTTAKAAAENVENLSGIHEVLPEISQLKQHWSVIQDLDAQLTKLETGVNDLQKTSDWRATQQTLPSGLLSAVSALLTDTDSLKSVILQRKQECAEKTASTIREVTAQMQRWSKTVKSEQSPLHQAAMDEGVQHQRVLDEMLSEQIFLQNCLGAKVTKKLRNKASKALKDSKPAFEILSKRLLDYSSRKAQLENTDFLSDEPSSEDAYTQMPPASTSSSATGSKIETQSLPSISEEDHPSAEPVNDSSAKRNGAADPTKQDQTCNLIKNANGSVACTLPETADQGDPDPVLKSKILQAASDPLKINVETSSGSKDDSNTSPQLMPEWLLTANKSLGQQADSQTQKGDTTSTETHQVDPDALNQEKQKNVTEPKKVFTIVLDLDAEDMQESNSSHPDVPRSPPGGDLNDATPRETDKKSSHFTSASPESNKEEMGHHPLPSEKKLQECIDAQEQEMDCQDGCGDPAQAFQNGLDVKLQETSDIPLSNSKLAEVSNTDTKSDFMTSSISPEQDETEPTSHNLCPGSKPSTTVKTEHDKEEAGGAELPDEDNQQPHESKRNELSSRQLCVAAAETTLPDVKQEEISELRHAKEQTGSSLSPQTGDDPKIQIPATDINQLTAADPAQPEGSEGENAEVTEGEPQYRRGSQPERTAPGGAATGGSLESCKKSSAMQDTMAEVQSLVEKSQVINRTPRLDLNWYLKFSPGEPEIRLIRTVQQVLACRYQPAQLSVKAMAAQLEEAEEFRRLVQEQVAVMQSVRLPDGRDANDSKGAAGQWNAALLDASATVQVKVAQLDEVKQYHRLMKIARAFLEVLAAEKEKANLNALGSSALQAKQLSALLQTMQKKKHIMEELLLLSSQLSVHLSDAESSGALLAQLGDVQEDWRLLEGSIKRALRHASNSTCQSSLLLKESQLLKAKLQALQTSNCENLDDKSVLEIVCLTTDLKLYNQLHLHLQAQSDSLISFSLGQKEKDEIRRSLQDLESLLSVAKSKVEALTHGCGVNLSTKLNKQLQELIVWAKQAENHISVGEKLALFPEEARIQIAEMKKFQTDILSRRSKMQAQFEQMASDMEIEESDKVFKTVEDLYDAIADSLDHVLDGMKKNLNEREKLLCELAGMDAWLAETHAKRDPCNHVENVSNADIRKLEAELRSHKIATAKLESSLKLVESLSEACEKIAAGLSPGESRYLVNRISGLWTELDGMLAHEKATCWELEELLHERTSSDQELASIQASLKQISAGLEEQKFPLTEATHSAVAHFKHMLMEHQCEVQELKHCQEKKRNSLLCSIGELQDRCKSLSANALEQQKYLHLRRQMIESRDIAEELMQRAKNEAIGVGERFRVCQALLVELPLIKTQCQEAADQLEAIAPELQPSDLQTEKEKIHATVETLVSWEQSATEDVKNLETEFLQDLRFDSELPAFKEVLENTRAMLEEAKAVRPDEEAIDVALQRHWVIWRNVESGMRVLEGLGRKEEIDMKEHEQLYSLRDAVMHECHSQMDSLSLARESIKDYQWAAQGAIAFLHNAEATFLSAPGGFLDCTEEQRQTQQALEALEDGFQAHICHLMERVPQQRCLSGPETERLHTHILSQLLVGRAVLEAQAHLRLESLRRCEMGEQTHRKCHEDVRQHLSTFESRLTDCAAQQVTSFEKCVAQQRRTQLLMEDLHGLAVKIEDLRAGCPMQGCGVGKDGELGALWRRRMSLRRGVGLLMAHTEQRGEEWKDITASMEQCCSFLANLQADVPDSSAVSFAQDEPQDLLAQAEMHQAGLEQEQQALASLEHRLEHALSLSTSHEPTSPGPVGKTLVKIQENVRSLKERNLQVVAAAQAEERERQHVQDEIENVEKHVLEILQSLDECSSPNKRQALRRDLISQSTKLKCITDGLQSRYAEIPADLGRTIEEVHLSLQQTEEKLMEKNNTVRKLSNRLKELDSGLETVKVLLEKRSPTLPEAQNVLKRVWDELDTWHSSLTLLESEVQDLAEEQPDQAHLLIERLTQPLQLYQNAAQMAEQRTTFLNRIPACLQEYEDLLFRASCWLDEAQSWLSSPCSFTTARSMQNHAKSLQLVMDDSERLRHNLQDFGSVLEEISCVCDMRSQKMRLEHNDQQVQKMQSTILEPLQQLLHAVGVVEAMEAEIKTVEKNIPKIRTILSSMDISYIPPAEHLHNRQVILANVQSMRRTLESIERSQLEFSLPKGAEQSLLVLSRPRQLLQPLEELDQLAQQQASQLEIQIRQEGETNQDPATVSNAAGEMQQRCRSLHRRLVQDLEETFNSEDMAEINAVSDGQELECPERTEPFSSLVEKSSKDAEAKVLPVKPEFNINSGSQSAEKELNADAGKAFISETVTAESLNAAVAAGPRLESPKHKAGDTGARTETPRAAAVVEDTRLIPSRPVNPFSAEGASDEFAEEEDEDLSLSKAPHPDPDDVLKVNSHPSSFVDNFHQPQVPSDASHSFSPNKQEDEELQRWTRLHSQITEKLDTLKKVKTEQQTVKAAEDGKDGVKAAEATSPESSSSVLQQTDDSISVLRKLVNHTDGSRPGLKDELREAAQSVLLSLDSLTDFVRTPADEDRPQMKLLQQECVSAQLATLSELVSEVESQTKEDADAHSSLTGLQDCLHTVQLVLTSSRDQLGQHPEVDNKQKELSSGQICLLEKLEPEQNETFPSLKDALSLECVLGRHLRESPGEKARLQHASQSLLGGIARLLALGEECIRERQTSPVHNYSKLQVVLCRDKKLLQVLRSQLAFVRHLFQHEPEALGRQEDQRVQLEVGAEALQRQALEQDVASQRTLREWTRWEDNCGQLGRALDESEAFISSGEPEGDDDEESVQRRLHACQRTLGQLDESRSALGILLDQGNLLRAEPGFSAPVGQTGGALELRWKNAHKRTEQEIQRCRDIQESRARFQTDFSSVGEWLPAANEHLKTLTASSQPSRECVRRNLIQVLDFSVDVEAMSALRASALRNATQLLHLREADCPELRTQLSQQETSWNRLTSDLGKTQDRLQQHLLAEQPPVELLSDLEEWRKNAKTRLDQEKEKILKAENSAQINEILQRYQALKAAIANGQLLLDFLSQPESQMMAKDVQALRAERTAFAENLGACKLRWLDLLEELQSQIRETEEMHQICVKRERRLPRLHGWLKQQRKQLDELKRPASQTLARKSLQEWEDVEGRVKEVAAALQELKSRRVRADENKEHPCDVVFSEQAESVCQACEDLTCQMADLRPTLQQTLEDWSLFQEKLRTVTLDTTRGRCALQHQRAPLLSLKQAEEYSDFLQQLQVKIGKGKEAWQAVDESCQSLGERLHRTAAQRLSDQVEVERKQWKDLTEELKDEHMNTEKILPLWQKYVGLSESCSSHLKRLWHQWEELSCSSPAPEQEISSVKKLQAAAEELQSSMGDVLEVSKHLIGRLEPPAVNLVVSETRLLSRDVSLLNEATSGRLKRLQGDSEQHEAFLTQLQVLEKETQSLLQTPKAGVHDAGSVQRVFSELSGLFPSLVDARETSTCASLNETEADRLHTLSSEWIKSLTRTSDVIRELQAERQRSQNFQEKCENLKSIQEKLEGESACHKSTSYSSLQERMATHQRLQADVIVGHQLLQGLQRDALESLEKESGEERFELLKQVAHMKESWSNCLASSEQNWVSLKEQLHRWKTYRRGSKRLWTLLTDVDSVLPPPGTSVFTLHQLLGSLDDYQHVNESLDLHHPVYAQTLEAGKHLCETMTESDCQSRLQSELQALTEAWERTSLLRRRRDHVNATVQMWSTCQDGINNIASELDELKLKKPDDSQEEAFIQETELCLQRLSGGLRELATMKTDLSQYVAASDSALLEQQLEQLHGQWEELCMKVSLRKQEIADRLNAWTIFNDKNKEFCDWLTQMENKVCHSGDLSIEEMVEKLKKDCMEEINLFSENKSHLKHLGEQLLLASDEAKQTQVRGSLQEVNQRWHSLFRHIEARVKKLKETLVTVQQLDKNMSNLRSWLSRIEAELSRPITYSVCHQQEIQKRLAEQQELQRDIEQHTEGVASVLNLCDVLLRDEDAAGGGTEAESDSLQETSRSLDQRWRTICTMAMDRRLRIEETWTLWCKFLNDYSRFEDWLKMAERTAANPNSADVLFTVAKEELKKFEGFQRQVHERLTQLELVNNQYRRLARENRTDRASQLRAMVHEGNRRWDALHRRVAAILRRLKHFTSQREEFESLRESMLVWLTELDLQLTNVEHFSESDVHQKIQQLNSFQKEITLNTERIDGLIVFGEGLIQRSSPQDAALIEDELEELHSYCQEVFGRLVRFHQRLSQPAKIKEEPELSAKSFSVESSLELMGRPLLGRSLSSLPATPTHLLERSGRETPMSVESLPLEWDHTGDVGGSSSHEDDEDDDHEEDGAYFSALSEFTEKQEEFVDASDAPQASSPAPSRSMVVRRSPRWRQPRETNAEASPTLTSTPLKPGYLRLMSQCSGSIENIKRLSLMLDDEEQPEEFGLTGLSGSDKQSGVIERWELLQAQTDSPQEPPHLQSQLHDVTSWLETVTPELERLRRSDPPASIQEMEARAKELKEMQKKFARYKSIMLSVNVRAEEAPELQESLTSANRDWSRACTSLQQWDAGLRKTLLRSQEFHETLHSLLLWLAHAESRRYAVDISQPETSAAALQQHRNTLTELQEELRSRQTQQASLQALWSQLQPADGAEESEEAQEKLHVTGNKLKLLLRQVEQDLSAVQQRLDCDSASAAEPSQDDEDSKTASSPQRERRDSSPPRSFFYRVLRAAFPLHLLLLLLLLLPCLIPTSEGDTGCSVTNNFARSFYPMLRYTNGPPPT
ncbi:unnamed protein product [Ophioblennius macclurei]